MTAVYRIRCGYRSFCSSLMVKLFVTAKIELRSISIWIFNDKSNCFNVILFLLFILEVSKNFRNRTVSGILQSTVQYRFKQVKKIFCLFAYIINNNNNIRRLLNRQPYTTVYCTKLLKQYTEVFARLYFVWFVVEVIII